MNRNEMIEELKGKGAAVYELACAYCLKADSSIDIEKIYSILEKAAQDIKKEMHR